MMIRCEKGDLGPLLHCHNELEGLAFVGGCIVVAFLRGGR